MTDLQRRGRLELLILLTFLGAIFLPGAAWGVWQARHDWRALGPAVGVVVFSLTVGAGLWRGDRRARWAAVGALALLGTFLIFFVGVGRGLEMIDREALAVYERIGFHPLAVFYGVGAGCLLAAAALAFSAPIRAYWDYRRAPASGGPSVAPSGRAPQQAVPHAAVAERVDGDPSRSPGECCLACGAPMPEEAARCASCGWTYSGSEGPNQPLQR
jgi:hypothetical protein